MKTTLNKDVIAMCARGRCRDAVEAYSCESCTRQNCPHLANLTDCAGCLKQYMLYCSLMSHDPDIRSALQELEYWQLHELDQQTEQRSNNKV